MKQQLQQQQEQEQNASVLLLSDLLYANSIGQPIIKIAKQFVQSIVVANDKQLLFFKQIWLNTWRDLLDNTNQDDKSIHRILKALQDILRKEFVDSEITRVRKLNRMFPIRFYNNAVKPSQSVWTKIGRGFVGSPQNKMRHALERHLRQLQLNQQKPQVKKQLPKIVNKSSGDKNEHTYDDDVMELLRAKKIGQRKINQYLTYRQTHTIPDSLRILKQGPIYEDLISHEYNKRYPYKSRIRDTTANTAHLVQQIIYDISNKSPMLAHSY